MAMGNLTIRQAEAKDVYAISEMDKRCFTMPWSYAAFEQEIAGNDMALYIVAEIEGQIVGYAGLWLILDEGHITNVAVHPDFRRRAVGKALLSVLIRASEEDGAMRHTLEVRASNEAAIRLYEGFGFRKYGLRRRYYEDNDEDAIIMWRGEPAAE